jgi:hypothetical protein
MAVDFFSVLLCHSVCLFTRIYFGLVYAWMLQNNAPVFIEVTPCTRSRRMPLHSVTGGYRFISNCGDLTTLPWRGSGYELLVLNSVTIGFTIQWLPFLLRMRRLNVFTLQLDKYQIRDEVPILTADDVKIRCLDRVITHLERRGDRWVWSNRGKPKRLGEKPDPLPFRPPRLKSHEVTRDWTRASAMRTQPKTWHGHSEITYPD